MTSLPAAPFEGTYPAAADFWVRDTETDQHPWRYGDLLSVPGRSPCLADSKGRPWRALIVTHPSCEVVSKGAPGGVQVVRVYWLREVSHRQGAEITTGYVESGGQLRVARAHQVYLAAVPGSASHGEPMFADLRKTARVPLDDLRAAGRIAALSHDARLAILRRDVYFRYRWPLTLDAIRSLERGRIATDAAFAGPRPDWAPPDASADGPGGH